MLLVRIDPAQRMDRWYSVEIVPTLFDTCAVVCGWGSRRTAYQRERVVAIGPDQAEAVAMALAARKMARGYVHVEENLELREEITIFGQRGTIRPIWSKG